MAIPLAIFVCSFVNPTVPILVLTLPHHKQIECHYNLVINRTYDGYYTEITTIYGQLEKILCVKIKSAPDEFDRKYGVDFYIEIKENVYIGLQIKPVSGRNIDFYNVEGFHIKNHEKFTNKYKGKVFFIFSDKINGKKQIQNKEIIDEIKTEIERLKNE